MPCFTTPIHEANLCCRDAQNGQFCDCGVTHRSPVTASVVPSGRGLPRYAVRQVGDSLRISFTGPDDTPESGRRGTISVTLPRHKTEPAEVQTIIISSALRKQGIGHRLYLAMVEEVQARGYPGIASSSSNRSPDANRAWERLRKTGRVRRQRIGAGPEYRDILERNDCHLPAGRPDGGQFCHGQPTAPYGALKARQAARRPGMRGQDAFVGAGRVDHVSELLEGYPSWLHGFIRQTRAKLMALTRADGNEHAAVKANGGPVQVFTSGSPDTVRYSGDLTTHLRSGKVEMMMHTHPTSSAPSLQDLRMQTRNGIPRQIILGADGSWYELEITDPEAAKRSFATKARQSAGFTATWLGMNQTKSRMEQDFNREKKKVSQEAAEVTTEWAARRFGWRVTNSALFSGPGFLLPNGTVISRKEAGELQPEIPEYHKAQFAMRSHKIWDRLTEKHSWVTIRYHQTRRTRAYAEAQAYEAAV